MKKWWIAVLCLTLLVGPLSFQYLWVTAQESWATDIKSSGEIRTRGEYNDNMDFNKAKDDLLSFVGQRSRINFDIDTGEVQGYIQVQDSRNWGEKSSTAPATTFDDTGRDLQATDLRQAYVLIKNVLGSPVTVKYGRQVLAYGDERLIGSFEWSNFTRAYDGIKLSYASAPVDVDLFTAKLNEANSSTVAPGTDANFSGLYATVKTIPQNNLQVYYLVDAGAGGKDEKTMGARLNGRVQAADYTGEFALQSGDTAVAGSNRDAHAYALMAGYTLADVIGGLRIGVEYDFATGNDAATADNEAFNNLYPTNHALYGLNDNGNTWSDIKAFALTVKAKPTKSLWTKLEYWNLQRDTGAGKEGTEVNLQTGYTYSASLEFLVQLVNFSPDSASGNDPQRFGVLQSTFRF
jgi:hypothetical protein